MQRTNIWSQSWGSFAKVTIFCNSLACDGKRLSTRGFAARFKCDSNAKFTLPSRAHASRVFQAKQAEFCTVPRLAQSSHIHTTIALACAPLAFADNATWIATRAKVVAPLSVCLDKRRFPFDWFAATNSIEANYEHLEATNICIFINEEKVQKQMCIILLHNNSIK